MKIHAYKVTEPNGVLLDTIITQMSRLSLQDRFKPVGSALMRLELAKKKGRYWQLDFAKMRSRGPGKISPRKPITNFRLGVDEGFGEETAAIYDTRDRFLIVQYNHHGPRAAAIELYLNLFLSGSPTAVDGEDDDDSGSLEFELGAVLKSHSYSALNTAGLIKTLRFKINVPGVRNSDLEAGASLSEIMKAPLPSGVKTLDVKMSAGRGKLTTASVVRDVKQLLRLNEEGVVDSIVVTAKADEDSPSEPLDMLAARLELDLPLTRNPRSRSRYSAEQRWEKLNEAVAKWKGQLE